MAFPLTTSDIGLWLAITAIILLITSEFLSTSTILRGVVIERTRLRLTAIGVGGAFMITVIMRIIQPF